MVIITDSIEELGLSVSQNEIGLVRSQIFYDVPGKVEQVDENIVIINKGNLKLQKNMKKSDDKNSSDLNELERDLIPVQFLASEIEN